MASHAPTGPRHLSYDGLLASRREIRTDLAAAPLRVFRCLQYRGGCRKTRPEEFARYLDISLGSLAELEYGFRLAEDLAYLKNPELDEVKSLQSSAGRLTRRLYEAVSGRGKSGGGAE